MFTLQVKYNGRWKWSIRTYQTMEDAKRRIAELARVGIKSRVRLAAARDAGDVPQTAREQSSFDRELR